MSGIRPHPFSVECWGSCPICCPKSAAELMIKMSYDVAPRVGIKGSVLCLVPVDGVDLEGGRGFPSCWDSEGEGGGRF